MHPIQKLSRLLKYGFYAAAALNIISGIIYPFMHHPFIQKIVKYEYRDLPVSVEKFINFSVGHKILIALSTLPTAIFYSLALYSAAKLLKLYEKGEYFSKETAKRFGNIGKFFIISVLVRFLQEPLFSFVTTMNEPKGQRLIKISASNHDFSAIMFALMIILVGWVMKEAVKIKHDQDLTV